MTEQTICTIRPGIVLQGNGGVSSGATVLAHKSADEYTDVILCHAPASIYHPYVVWTYNHETGSCFTGDYYKTEAEARERYAEREY